MFIIIFLVYYVLRGEKSLTSYSFIIMTKSTYEEKTKVNDEFSHRFF